MSPKVACETGVELLEYWCTNCDEGFYSPDAACPACSSYDRSEVSVLYLQEPEDLDYYLSSAEFYGG